MHNTPHTEETKRILKEKGTGSKNSQFGKFWITNGKDNKKIRKDEFDLYANIGWKLGRTATQEFRNTMSAVMSGKKYKPRTEEHRKKLSESLKGSIPWNKGKTGCYSKASLEKMGNARRGKSFPLHTEETKKKISDTLVGHAVLDETKEKLKKAHTGKIHSEEHRHKCGIAMRGKHHSAETKLRISDLTKKYILEHGCAGNSVGLNESILLDAQEKIDGCKIDRNFTILLYKPDGYCHETNTIYEVYEKYHTKRVQKDLERKNEICNRLGCNFVIIYDKTH